jgi:glutamine---fructose-6-phosphate transaminase (isomerizing)
MCGITAYVGKRHDAAQIVLSGLKALEYRGYDSWGIAIKKGKSIAVDKHTGKIGQAQTSLATSSIAIGHTRWATHGGVTIKNAHPHLDCTKHIAVLHNGIIENFAPIKKALLQKNHTFHSETDTEILPHVIEDNLKTMGFAQSVRSAFNACTGMNAVVAMYTPSQEIVAAKNGSPLIVGVGQDEFFVASDASALLPYTNTLLFLKDNEMVILGKTLQLIDLITGKKLKPSLETIDWKVEETSLGTHDHYMIKEIYDQPKVIRNIVQNYDGQIKELAGSIQKARGTFFIAAGTAYYASLAGVYLFSKVAKRHVNAAVASEFNYLEHFLKKDSLIIALSQSGETIDVIEPLQRAAKKGSCIAAITNSLGSSIYRMADHKLLLGAGPEKAVASTKAYIAKLAVLLLLAYQLNGGTQEIKDSMLEAAKDIERLLEKKNLAKLKRLARVLSSKDHLYTLGRGVSFASALEAALKIKEVSYIHTEGFAGGELKHGTIALIEKDTPCIVFVPDDETYDAMISNATEIKARGGMIIGVGAHNNPIFDHFIEVKNRGDATLLSQIIPAQLLGYFLALEKGYDPDKPRNLAKSVTVK